MMNVAALSFILLLLAHSSHQFKLYCNYTMHSNYIGTYYTCIGHHVLTFYDDRNVTEVIGEHIEGRINNDVQQFFVKFQNCHYMPLNLGQFFPNLESLYIMKSNLQHLLPGDLDGLHNLRAFDASHNPVEKISASFFAGHYGIESISFFDAHIKKVEKGTFDELSSLTFIDFDFNECYSKKIRSYDMKSSLADLYDKCDGHGVVVKQHKPHAQSFDIKVRLSAWLKLGFVLIVLLLVTDAVLGVALFRIYSKNAQKSWHEMVPPLMNDATERNCE